MKNLFDFFPFFSLWSTVLNIFLFIGLNGFAQNTSYVFHQLSIKNNLSSQNLNYFIYKDTKGFIWISSSEGLNRYDGENIQQFHSIKNDTNTLVSNVSSLSDFYEDSSHNIWFGMPEYLQMYERTDDNFRRVTIYREDVKINGDYYLLALDSLKNDFWISINDSLYVIPNLDSRKPIFIGEYKINFNSKFKIDKDGNGYFFIPSKTGLLIRRFKEYYEVAKPDSILNNFSIRTIFFQDKSHLYLGTDDGLVVYNLETDEYQMFNNFDNHEITKINAIIPVDDHHIFIGTQSVGLFSFDTSINKFTKQIYQFDGLSSKPFLHPIDKLYMDKDNTIWISTTGRGVFYTNLVEDKFNSFLQHKEGDLVEDNFIRSITEDNIGRLWCLTLNGISIISEKGELLSDTDKFKGSTVAFSESYPYYIFCSQDGIIWVCDETGLYYLPQNEDNFKMANIQENGINQQRFFTNIKELATEEIICSSDNGVLKWNKKEIIFEKISGLDYNQETFSWVDENIETDQILLRKAQTSFLIGHFQKDSFYIDTTINFQPFVHFLHRDTVSRKFWLATSDGLFWIGYNYDKYEIKKDSILPFKSIIGVLKEDNSDNLWLSTNRGIVRYNPKLGKWKTFTLSDGLQSQEFNFFASHKTRDGKMIFGGVNGINIFDPKEIKDNLDPVNPTITSILINDAEPEEKLECSETGAKNVSLIEKLDFDEDHNTLSFRFAALDYVNPDANQFKYRMIGMENDWTPPKTENFARYPNLPAGDYIFEVDATNSDGIWSENPARLRITIHPPWYQTNVAYSSFTILGLFLLYSFYQFQLSQRLKQAESHRLKELDNLKTALYTNITHEFRTPLTVIMGMANQIAEKPREWQQQGLEMIQRSGQNLLNLVNQMLDLAKIEAGSMQPKYVQGNIIIYLQYLVEAFHSYAATKNINLVFYKEVDGIIMDYDVDKLRTVVTNLLSNAVKFTPEKGKIIVHANLITKEIPTRKGESVSNSFCQIKIRDNGIGIAAAKLPHVFDRFYQVEDHAHYSGGTGVGLALTKELVELMEGTITVNSRLNDGSEFVILLPFRQTAPLVKDQLALPAEQPTFQPFSDAVAPLPKVEQEDENLPLVLIIEDNLDVITYLQACLMDRYRVIIALDGQSGIDKAIEQVPDLIISDVMMPEKDGFEVCDFLKQDERSSHIPIILLTARAHIADKITGLSKGADAYLAKPFHQQELEIRLEQLLLQRKRLQTYFAQQTIAQNGHAPTETITAPKENAFLQKVEQVIEDNLMADLELEQICKLLAMSRSQVYRKIKALTGYSSTIYIRRIRLKHAYRLLKTTDSTVSEVAYQVGFKDPSFFSRSFSEVYEQSPTDVKNG